MIAFIAQFSAEMDVFGSTRMTQVRLPASVFLAITSRLTFKEMHNKCKDVKPENKRNVASFQKCSYA